MTRLLTIDGTQGEGGGQVLRTSLALSAITGRPIEIDGVRGGRRKPGLVRQHLTGVLAAAEICGARVDGAALKSERLVFEPGAIRAGDYRFEIGTAGSTALVIQTVLPILAHADGDSAVTVTGGTHALAAPSTDYLADVFLPQWRRMGLKAELELVRHGFYPAGGGEVALRLSPWTERRALQLDERGEAQPLSARVLHANLPPNIANRELKALQRHLGIADERAEILHVEAAGPGNTMIVDLPGEHVTEQFTEHGQHGIKAETLAKRLADAVKAHLVSEAPVGEHLADQLLLPMALGAGGTFTCSELSLHARTNMDVIRAFGVASFDIDQEARKRWRVTVRPVV
ncbi:MAG: RNA 3'-terminal phosphate cyclase [Litorimonas sp.]